MMLNTDVILKLRESIRYSESSNYAWLVERIIETGNLNYHLEEQELEAAESKEAKNLSDSQDHKVYTDDETMTLLMMAVCDLAFPIDVIAYFLEIGMDPNIQNFCYLETALMLAVSENNKGAFKLLLAHGANPNLQDLNGFTALHDAVESGLADYTLELLQNNADPNIPNGYGATALICAVKALRNYHNLESLKPSAQIAIRSLLDENKSMKDYEEIIAHLLAYGADPNFKDTWGSSALDYAKKYGLTDIYEKLSLAATEVVLDALNYDCFAVQVKSGIIHLVFYDAQKTVIGDFTGRCSEELINKCRHLIKDVSHAIYLGMELAKADMILKDSLDSYQRLDLNAEGVSPFKK